MKNPGFLHWQAAVRVLQYREATKLVGLRYIGGLQVEGMCDSSWGDDVDDRRSQAAFVFTMGRDGCELEVLEIRRGVSFYHRG